MADGEKHKLESDGKTESSRIYKRTEFDGVLDKVNDFSRFQWMQWLILFIAVIPQAWYTYAPAFAARKVKNTASQRMMHCKGDTYRNMSVCDHWGKTGANGSCSEVIYTSGFTSVVTEVGRFTVTMVLQCHGTKVRDFVSLVSSVLPVLGKMPFPLHFLF